MNIVALAGGVGGAKLADGLAQCLPPPPAPPPSSTGEGSKLTVIVNTGDDFDWMGLRICPDLDTVMYTLAGLAKPVIGGLRSALAAKTAQDMGLKPVAHILGGFRGWKEAGGPVES